MKRAAPMIPPDLPSSASRIWIYVSPPVKEDLREWAFGQHKALSQLVRELLEAAVTKRRKSYGRD